MARTNIDRDYRSCPNVESELGPSVMARGAPCPLMNRQARLMRRIVSMEYFRCSARSRSRSWHVESQSSRLVAGFLHQFPLLRVRVWRQFLWIFQMVAVHPG